MMTVNTESWMINVAAPRTWKVIEVQKMKAKKYWMTYKQDTVGQSNFLKVAETKSKSIQGRHEKKNAEYEIVEMSH